jgi:hypothetical protein
LQIFRVRNPIVWYIINKIGFWLIFSPLYAVLSIIPLLAFIGKFLIFVEAFFVTSITSMLTISFAWIAYRPLISISIILLTIAITLTVIFA